jgi:hypothetical protein
VNNEIEKSRQWYRKTYGENEKDGNKLTKYPIKELKKYAEWLGNQMNNNNSHAETKELTPTKREINVEETKIEKLIKFLQGCSILPSKKGSKQS